MGNPRLINIEAFTTALSSGFPAGGNLWNIKLRKLTNERFYFDETK